MDAATQAPEATVIQALPWLSMTLDYTDKLAAIIPEEMIDWRPVDPNGKYFFSLAEILLHCADSRRMFARQLAGTDANEEGYWSDEPSEDGTWPFKPHGGKQAVLDALAETRAELAEWYYRPAREMTGSTPGTQAVFDRVIAELKEKGKDVPPEVLARGPATLMRVMMATACHESGHRGALQTLLRLQGIDTSGVWGE